MEPQWEKLGEAVLHRRASKGWTQEEVWDRGGPSDTLQTEIEAKRWKPTRSSKGTLKKIDIGMEWMLGSAADVLAGHNPTPVEDLGSEPPAERTVRGMDAEEINRSALHDLIVIYNEHRDAPPTERMEVMLGALRRAVGAIRAILLRDEEERTVRAYAIDALNPADAAITFLQQALDEMKGERHAVEASTEPDAPTEADKSKEALLDEPQGAGLVETLDAVADTLDTGEVEDGDEGTEEPGGPSERPGA